MLLPHNAKHVPIGIAMNRVNKVPISFKSWLVPNVLMDTKMIPTIKKNKKRQKKILDGVGGTYIPFLFSFGWYAESIYSSKLA